jgi:hypothetical protein
MVGQAVPQRRKPWFLRPAAIITAALTVLATLATVPPLLASPTPVELTQQGQDNAEADGWSTVELGIDAQMELLGGLVTLETHALQKNDEDGYPTAGYTWATLKIPAMLPRDMVEDRLRENALEAVQDILQGLSLENGAESILLDTTPTSDTTFNGNGHNTRITHYQATARLADPQTLSDELGDNIHLTDDLSLQGQAFIATWRCNILGSYALAFAVARDQIDPETTLQENLDGIDQPIDPTDADALAGLDPHQLEELLDEDNEITIDEIHLKKSSQEKIDQIIQRLLSQTVCANG